MHANVQTRFNPATGEKALYYRLKESYRDVAGHVHSLILLNIGFEPSLTLLLDRNSAEDEHPETRNHRRQEPIGRHRTDATMQQSLKTGNCYIR